MPKYFQPLAGFEGNAMDIDVHAREILRMRDVVNALYAQHTGQTVERIQHDTERDNFMSPEQAAAYGLIDHVLSSPRRPPDPDK